jgi:hypothetical protein
MGKDVMHGASGLLPGTLEMLILRICCVMRTATLTHIDCKTFQGMYPSRRDSLYSALQRLLLDGYVERQLLPSENNRARYDSLTLARGGSSS